METTANRRVILGRMARLGTAVVAGVALGGAGAVSGALDASADETGFFRTTAHLNLRSGPRSDQRVRLVIPQGAMVTSLGGSRNGYRKVSYQGTPGWAHGDYLEVTNGGSTDVPIMVGTAITTDSVNMRSGPSTGHSVIRVLPTGTRVEVADTYQNGYRYVGYAAIGGWIYATYLGADDEAPQWYLKATSNLNLRQAPEMSAKIITVIPAGASVRFTDQRANGFRQVVFNGTTGWAYEAYLA